MRRFGLLLPFLVFLVSLTGYLVTLTQVHTFDALSYVLDVDRRNWRELFHPHHLAYGPFGILVRNLSRWLGWHESARVPLQVANALAGGLGVALLFRLVQRVTGRLDLALSAALLLGGSYAYWYYAVEVEVYTSAALFLILCLWGITGLLQHPRISVCVALGATQGLAVLFHQSNMLLCVPVGVALLLVYPAFNDRLPVPIHIWRVTRIRSVSGRWLVGVLAYGLILGIITAGSYLLVGLGFSGLRTVEALVAWGMSYARTGWWGGTATGMRWADLGSGLSATLAQPGGALAGLWLAGLLVLYARRLFYRYPRLALCLVAWLLTYAAFFFWWEPDNIEFWIASLPPAVLLLALALASAGPPWHPGVLVTLVVGIAMITVNADAIVRRGAAPYDLQRRMTHALVQQSAPDDLLLVPDGMLELYLPYYGERDNTYSLNQALFDADGNWPAACAQVRQRIDQTLFRGAAVMIDEAVLYPTAVSTGRNRTILERFQLTPEQITQCFAVYVHDLVPLRPGGGLPTYYRLPSAQELVVGPGWQFTAHGWGWQARNVQDQHFGSGWHLVPGGDAALVSPRVRVDTSRYRAIEIRMAAATTRRDAQLFFIDREGTVDERRAVRWTLAPGPAMTTYRLDLRNTPGWTGLITGLRLDPVGVGDGEWVQLATVRLIP